MFAGKMKLARLSSTTVGAARLPLPATRVAAAATTMLGFAVSTTNPSLSTH
jgi:hypothetical protein